MSKIKIYKELELFTTELPTGGILHENEKYSILFNIKQGLRIGPLSGNAAFFNPAVQNRHDEYTD
jgi:hypothetical protein